MLLQACVLMSGLALVASSVYVPKHPKLSPSITHSLINLGKMDIAFYFDGAPNSANHKKNSLRSNTEVVMEAGPCPCNSMKNFLRDQPMLSPSDIFNKIVSGNELFHHSKEPVVSGLCCGSQEETIIIEPPRSRPLPMPSALPIHLPFNLDFPAPSHFPSRPDTSKVFEIVLLGNPDKKMQASKKDLSFVGKDNFKLFNLNSFLPLNQIVKKDLNKRVQTKSPGPLTTSSTAAGTPTDQYLPEIKNNSILQNGNGTDAKAAEYKSYT